MRLLLPLILVIAAIGLFVLYTSPTYQGLKGLQAQVAAYDDALNKSKELKGLRDKLASARNAFSPQDEQKLVRLLPDQVDNIRLIIDINNIASRRSLALSNTALGQVSNTSAEQSTLSVGPSGDPLGSVSLGFSVVAGYEEFLAFLQDIEHSLRILDIEKLSFGGEQANKYTFNIQLRTYWLH
ncbi:MAG TPA: type 4a pilus biogenesis protein PilO [Candidatus Paceibacterota bacterium]